MKLPNWFSRPKQDKPQSSADIAVKLKAAEEAHAAAQLRVETARATLAAVRDDAALEGLRVAKHEAEDAAEMLTILRADNQAAVAQERQEHLAHVRAQRDAAREMRAQQVTREGELATAAARALLEGWCTLHLERVDAVKAIQDVDRQVRALSGELAEEEPPFNIRALSLDLSLVDAIEGLAGDLRPAEHALVHSLISAVCPGYHYLAGLQGAAKAAIKVGEARRLESIANPPPRREVVHIGEIGQPQRERPMVAQLRNLLTPDDAA